MTAAWQGRKHPGLLNRFSPAFRKLSGRFSCDWALHKKVAH
jgi:hypothetical protein